MFVVGFVYRDALSRYGGDMWALDMENLTNPTDQVVETATKLFA